MIVDCHVHVGEGVGLPDQADVRSPVVKALARSAAAGIDAAVILPGFSDDYGTANLAVARLVRAHPWRFLGFACVHAERDRGRVARLLAEAAGALGLVGVKVHRRDAPLSDEICLAAAALGLPILYDPMGDADAVASFARRHPRTALIVPHLSSFADDAAAQRRFIRVLATAPNVFGDTSAVKVFDLLEQAACDAGAAKLLFGSDSPWCHPGLELAKVRALGLPPDDERRVLGGTLLRLVRRRGMPGAGRQLALP